MQHCPHFSISTMGARAAVNLPKRHMTSPERVISYVLVLAKTTKLQRDIQSQKTPVFASCFNSHICFVVFLPCPVRQRVEGWDDCTSVSQLTLYGKLPKHVY